MKVTTMPAPAEWADAGLPSTPVRQQIERPSSVAMPGVSPPATGGPSTDDFSANGFDAIQPAQSAARAGHKTACKAGRGPSRMMGALNLMLRSYRTSGQWLTVGELTAEGNTARSTASTLMSLCRIPGVGDPACHRWGCARA